MIIAVSSYLALCVIVATGPSLAAWVREARGAPLRRSALVDTTDDFCAALGIMRLTPCVVELRSGDAVLTRNGRVLIAQWLVNKYKSGELTEEEASFAIARSIGVFALNHGGWERIVRRCGLLTTLLVAGCLRLGWKRPFRFEAVCAAAREILRHRQAEALEADAFAAQLMRRSNVDPHAGATYLAKMHGWAVARSLRKRRPPPLPFVGGVPVLIEERIDWIVAVARADAVSNAEQTRRAVRRSTRLEDD